MSGQLLPCQNLSRRRARDQPRPAILIQQFERSDNFLPARRNSPSEMASSATIRDPECHTLSVTMHRNCYVITTTTTTKN